VADEMASRSLSYNGALQDLGTLLHRIALAQTVPTALPDDLPELADIQRLALAFDPQEVQLYYQIAVIGRNEIGLAPDEYAGFTMTLLRMLAFRPGQGGAEQVAAPAPAAIARALPAAAPANRGAAAAAAAQGAPARPAAPPAAASAAQPAAPGPAQPAQAAPHATPAHAAPSAAPMTAARAAINAALEAARAASRGQAGGVRRSAPSAAPADAAAAAQAAPVPAAPAPQPAPAPAARPAAPAASAPWDGAPNAGARSQPQSQPQAMAPPQAQAQPQSQPQMAAPGYQRAEQAVAEDEPPAWVTEFSDDTALASAAPAEAQAPVSAPVRQAQPAQAPHAYVITPVPEIDWDGNWPALAAGLPLRGVSQQLALQTELVECVPGAGAVTFRLRVPVDTLRASGNSEKLCAALQECFPAVRVNIDTEIGPVWYTAGAEARARRERLQQEAEATVDQDPFVQAMARTFDAFVVPGSVRPIAT